MEWEKVPRIEGYYWYKDAHQPGEDYPIIVQVHTDVEGTSVSYHDGEVWTMEDIRDDFPWFMGPLPCPTTPCPGTDGYYS